MKKIYKILDEHCMFMFCLTFLGLVVWAFVAISNMEPAKKPNQATIERVFKECMAILPKGAESIHNSNDWDEVVGECRNHAYDVAVYESRNK